MASPTLLVADYPIGFPSGFGETLYNLFTGFPEQNLLTAYPAHLSPSKEKARGISVKLPSPQRPRFVKGRVAMAYYPFLKVHQYFASQRATQILAEVVRRNAVKNLIVVPVSPWILSTALALHRSLSDLNLVVFVMDDWQGHHECHNLPYSRARQRLLADVISRAKARFAVSREMAEHYQQVYGNEWKVAHNGINSSAISPATSPHNSRRVLLAGDVNVFRFDAVIAFAKAIERYNASHMAGIEFTILGDIAEQYRRPLSEVRSARLMGRQSHSACLAAMQDSDLLYLPLAFEKRSYRISRYSLPTKLPEYLASGKTVLIHAPRDSATFRLAERHDLSPRVGSQNGAELDQFIEGWINGNGHGREAQSRAMRALTEEFDITKLAREFQASLV